MKSNGNITKLIGSSSSLAHEFENKFPWQILSEVQRFRERSFKAPQIAAQKAYSAKGKHLKALSKYIARQ